MAAAVLCMLFGCGSEDAGHFALDVGNADSQQSSADEEPKTKTGRALVAYESGSGDISRAAEIIADALSADITAIGDDSELSADNYQYVFLGFEPQDGGLSASAEEFLERNDFGARTIYMFVTGNGDSDALLSIDLYSAVSRLQPGALMGDEMLMLSSDTSDEDIRAWANDLGINASAELPEAGDTVANVQLTPDAQQVIYLWEEGNMPSQTVYTSNTGNYFDDPDFRPYITFYPVPSGTDVKGAVLICPGGAFQFRSDIPEGTDVARELSALGYQSFVVDYRLRPYTQQEGALDLARAVRFVRSPAQDYGIDPDDIAVMGFSAGGILCGEMPLNYDSDVQPTELDPDYEPDELDAVSADAAACGMIYSFYGRLSVGTTDVELLRSGDLPPTFYCYGTRDPFYDQFLANADAAQEAGVEVERLQLDDMPHGFGADGDWIPTYDGWLDEIFEGN